MTVNGVDVSHHQGVIDWKKMAAGGKEYAIIRCTMGATEDETYERNRKGAKKNRLVVAAYAFGVTERDGKQQADAALEVVGDDVGIFLDIEDWKDNDGVHHKRITVPQAEDFAKRVDARGRFLGTYTSIGEFGTAKSDFLARFPLWVAHYTDAPKPKIPSNWKRWAIWQHTSSGPGKKLGTATEGLDLNRYKGSLESLKEWFTGKVEKAEQSDEVDETPGPDDSLGRNQEEAIPVWPGYEFERPSPQVRRWQRRMRGLGFQLAIDGVYGSESEQVCVEFQMKKGLEEDGIVGQATWDASFRDEG
jgi:GH25 family lysozyme M1 (1,4-beta-N-acetylmuramidase)